MLRCTPTRAVAAMQQRCRIAAHVERVIRGTTFPAGKLLEPGVVQWDVKGETTFGPFEYHRYSVVCEEGCSGGLKP